MSKNHIAGLFWLIAPALTALGIFLSIKDSAGAGYALGYVGMLFVVVSFILVLFTGLITKTLKYSFLGYFFSFVVSFIVINVGFEIDSALNEYKFGLEKEDVSKVLPAIHSGKKEDISNSLSKLAKLSIPDVMCILTTDYVSGSNSIYLSDDPFANKQAKYPFSLQQLFTVLEAVTALKISDDQLSASFYQILNVTASRGSVNDLANWLDLWGKSQLANSSKLITIAKPFDKMQLASYCSGGSTENIASFSTDAWGDEGILAWLNAGFLFAPEQQRIVLTNVKSAQVLNAVIKSGIDINARDPEYNQGGYKANTLFNMKAERLYQDINESEDPMRVVQLVDTFIKNGVDYKSPSVTGTTPCEDFRKTEEYLSYMENISEEKLKIRKNAFNLIKEKLCVS